VACLLLTPAAAGPSEDEKEQERLGKLFAQHRDAGRYAEAVAVARQILPLDRKINGDAAPSIATELEVLAELETILGHFPQALAALDEAAEVYRRQPAPPIGLRRVAALKEDVAAVRALSVADREVLRQSYDQALQSRKLINAGRNQEARAVGQKSLDQRKRLLAPRHLLVADALLQLSTATLYARDFPACATYAQQALEIYDGRQGPGSVEAAMARNNLGLLASAVSDLKSAHAHLEAALAVFRTCLGEDASTTALVHNNLAMLHDAEGNLAAARAALEKALAGFRKAFGEDHRDTVKAHANLGFILMRQGDFSAARRVYDAVLAACGRSPDPPVRAVTLSNLSVLLTEQGDFDQAERVLLEALQLCRDLEDDGRTRGMVLNNLALAAYRRGDRRKARQGLESLVASFRKAGKSLDLDAALALANLAAFAREDGDLAAARDAAEQAVAIYRAKLGPRHPFFARAVGQLGGVLFAEGQTGPALCLEKHAVGLLRTVLGSDHPDTAAWERNLGRLHLARGEPALARPFAEAALEGQLHAASNLIWTLAGAEALAYVQEALDVRDLTLSVLDHLPDRPAADAYRAVWSTRGLATSALTARTRLAASTPEARPIAESLRQTRTLLAKVLLYPAAPAEAAARKKRLEELTAQKEELERRLAAVSAPFARSRQRPEFSELAARLPPGVAVVDFVRRADFGPHPDGQLHERSRYDAFILRHADEAPGYHLSWVSLGRAEPIDRAVRDWRTWLSPRTPDPAPKNERPDAELRRLVWGPVEKHLDGCRVVLIVPDSTLTGVPWPALPGREPSSYLVEHYTFGLLNHPAQLLERGERDKKEGQLLVVGGVDYGPATSKGLGWNFLPKSHEEARQVAEQWHRDTTLLEGQQVTEAAVLTALPAARYVHLCTHGFFADARFRSALASAGVRSSIPLPGTPRASGRNPLALSGIVLADANRHLQQSELPAGAGLGLLTGEAIAGLDLGGVDLVVLSACRTGVGEVAGGEGVFGLQRAFHLAGARTVVASLWEVPDNARLFTEFYGQLWGKGLPALEALRRAQLALLRQHDVARRPLMDRSWYWAAWMLSGDPGDLETLVRSAAAPLPAPSEPLSRGVGSLTPVFAPTPSWPEDTPSDAVTSAGGTRWWRPWLVGGATAGMVLLLALALRWRTPLPR
jgi:CHAT domain-containing protein/Tfp pilus assembly protein PilF